MADAAQQEADVTGEEPGEGTAIKPENSKAVEGTIRRVYKDISKHKADRTTANETITALRDELVNKGFSKKSQRVVEMYMELNDEQQEFFWMAVEIQLKAHGKPMQGRLELVK